MVQLYQRLVPSAFGETIMGWSEDSGMNSLKKGVTRVYVWYLFIPFNIQQEEVGGGSPWVLLTILKGNRISAAHVICSGTFPFHHVQRSP